MKPFALTNATVMTGDAVLAGASVIVEDGLILAVHANGRTPAGMACHSLAGKTLAPGFIDAQVNGGGGVLFNDTPTVEGLRRMAAAHRRFGTTGLLPTLITDKPEAQHAAAAAVEAAIAASVPGILGIHFEGPHLSPAFSGAHEAALIRPPDEADMAFLTRPRAGVTLVTLAPETVSPAVLRRLAAAGVILCAGHTNAGYDEMRAAFADGVAGVTHLYNRMPPMAARDPGALGAALTEDAAWCGIILDGHHLHDAMAKLAWRAKPPGRLILVTDAMPPVGTEMTEFILNGRRIFVRDGCCWADENTRAGSVLDMAAAVRHAVTRIGIPLDEALRMAATYPARCIGLGDSLGRIAPGYRADLACLDEGLQVVESWVGGQPIPP